PKTCPVCGAPAIRGEDEAVRRCSAELTCPAQLLHRLRYFVAREALDIDGLGPKQLALFIQKGWVKTPADLFHLARYKAELLDIDGFGEQSVARILDAIEAARMVSLRNFIAALGIRDIGGVLAKKLAEHYRTAKAWMEAMINANDREGQEWQLLTSTHGVGTSKAGKLAQFFASPENRQSVEELCQVLQIADDEAQAENEQNHPLAGKILVFTGQLEAMTRMEAKAQAERLGCRVASSISAKTDYLIAGTGAGSKAAKAKELGVQVLDEAEWQNLMSQKL
ncbi:MAG: helix-hairpin-helix domain-containing protein, partial [Pseudomonadota bacterium]